jgi:hypothetical protein
MIESEHMSTASHKSRTRILSEEAMKRRVHTSRQERDLTGDGVSKHHNEATALKAKSTAARTKITKAASTAKAEAA